MGGYSSGRTGGGAAGFALMLRAAAENRAAGLRILASQMKKPRFLGALWFNHQDPSLALRAGSLLGHRLHRGDLDRLRRLVHGTLDGDFRAGHLEHLRVVARKDERGLVGCVVESDLGALLLDALGGAILVSGLRAGGGAVVIRHPTGPGPILGRSESGETEPGDNGQDENPRHEFLHTLSFF